MSFAESLTGHETTSGMLSFTVYHLLKNPDTLIKLREELDRVIGNKEVGLDHLDKLEYLLGQYKFRPCFYLTC